MKRPISRWRYFWLSVLPFGSPVTARRERKYEARGKRFFEEYRSKQRRRPTQAVPPPPPIDLTERIHVYEAISEVYRVERDAAVAALVVAIMEYGKVKHGEAKDEAWKAIASWMENPSDAASVARGVSRIDVPNLIHE